MSFNFLNESPEFPYTVAVQPPPADTSEVSIHKQTPDGEELAVETLQTQGSGVFTLDLSGRSLEESPLWLKFTFEKLDPDTNDVIGHNEILLAVPLGEPVPGRLSAPADAISGDTVEVKVEAWGAHAWDGDGDDPRYFPPGEGGAVTARVPSDAKSAVKWTLTQIEGEGDDASRSTEDLSDTGDTLNFSITDDHLGKTLEFEAYVGDDEPPGHAKVQVKVPKIVVRAGEDDPPETVGLGETVRLTAVVTPEVEGSITWETDPANTDALTVARGDDGDGDVTGRKATADDQKVKLKPKLVSLATEKETFGEHEVGVTPRTIDVHFQRSPGVGEARGIGGLEWKVSDPAGNELGSGTTGEDGLIELPFGGDGTKLELLSGGSPVAEYTVNLRADEPEALRSTEGLQRRLRLLGYHLGQAGDEQNGVDGEFGPITDRAVANFQADHDRNFTGVAGNTTRRLIDSDAQPRRDEPQEGSGDDDGNGEGGS